MYRIPLNKFLLNFIPIFVPYQLFWYNQAYFCHPSSTQSQTYWTIFVCQIPSFVQVITYIELALRKYMYHSQKSYIDRARMRREWNKLLFILYCTDYCKYCWRQVVLMLFLDNTVVVKFSTFAKIIMIQIKSIFLEYNLMWNICTLHRPSSV